MPHIAHVLLLTLVAVPTVPATCVDLIVDGQKIQRCNCASDGKPVQVRLDPSALRSAGVLLLTVYNGSSQVFSGMDCSFSIVGPPGSRIYIRVEPGDVVPERSSLLVLDGADQLLRMFSRQRSPQQLVSRTGRVQVIFRTLNYPDADGSTGHRIRLTAFSACPPNWQRFGGHCFSRPGDNRLEPHEANFASAQLICNKLRANLLVASPGVLRDTGIGQLSRLARWFNVTTPVWIGLRSRISDADERQFTWIDAGGTAAELDPSWLSCHSDDSKPSDSCKPDEQFAYLRHTTDGFLVLDSPLTERQFICYATLRGSDPAPWQDSPDQTHHQQWHHHQQSSLEWLPLVISFFLGIASCLVILGARYFLLAYLNKRFASADSAATDAVSTYLPLREQVQE